MRLNTIDTAVASATIDKMSNRYWTLLVLAIIVIFTTACEAPSKVETETCNGQAIEGPWFRFLLPDGMTVDGVSNGQVKSSSVWLDSQVAGEPISFFLFSPRHGGKPYQIFLDSTDVRKLVEFDTENGETEMYIITYKDGTIGRFEGNAQRITGLRVGSSPLGQEELEKYNCFLSSIEQYAE